MSQKSVKTRIGVVVSDKMKKTVVVELRRLVKHDTFKRYMSLKKSVKAHDEKSECKVGDKVLLVETRPLSKDKHWRVRQVLSKGAQI